MGATSNAMHARRATATNSGCRAAMAALLAIAVLLCSQERARAEDLWGEHYPGIGGGIVAAASVTFLVADVAYTAQGRWLSPQWAKGQIIIGGGVDAAVALWGLSAPSSRRVPVIVAASVLSLGFIAHGVASLVLYEPPHATETPRGFGRKTQTASVRLVPDFVVARDGTTLIALRGAF